MNDKYGNEVKEGDVVWWCEEPYRVTKVLEDLGTLKRRARLNLVVHPGLDETIAALKEVLG